jgi:hypothetical protein
LPLAQLFYSTFHSTSATFRRIARNRLNRGGGGAAILVCRNIQHSVISSLALQSIEAVDVSLHLTSQGSGGNCTLQVLQHAIYYLHHDALFINSPSVFVCGNLNCKHPSWSSRVNNPNSPIPESYTKECRLRVLALQHPTHMTKTEISK